MATRQSPRPCHLRRVALAEELEELHALAQAPFHHLRAHHHFAHDRGDFRCPEIKAFVEGLDVIEDFGVRQMRIVQRGDLHAVIVDELGIGRVQPAIGERLVVQECARIGGGERGLDAYGG